MNDVIARLRELLGPDCITDLALAEGFLSDWRGLFHGNAACVLRPRSTDLLAQNLRICHESKVAIVPQGGNTGLVGGATPDNTGLQVVVSTRLLRKIRKVDPVDMSIVAEAGASVVELQNAAAEARASFPVLLQRSRRKMIESRQLPFRWPAGTARR